eukprot:scaffold73_cov337-Pavlova_lutheri.AAC.69
MGRAFPDFQLRANTHLPQFGFHPQRIIHEHFFGTAMNHGWRQSREVTKQWGCHGIAQTLWPLYIHPCEQTPLETDVAVLKVGGESGDFDPEWIEEFVGFVVDGDGLSCDGHICPWREGDGGGRHGYGFFAFLVLLLDQQQGGKHQPTTGRVSGEHDASCFISMFQQPFICSQCIFHCTWEWMQWCQSVIHTQHRHFGRGGHPGHHLSMCQQRAAHVSTSMQVQHHASRITGVGTQPFARHAVRRHLLHAHARDGQVRGVALGSLQGIEVEGAAHGSVRRKCVLHLHAEASPSTRWKRNGAGRTTVGGS